MKTFLVHLGKFSLGLVAISLFFFPNNSYANDRFLTSPFLKEQKLLQGWFYDFGNRAHQGIDYYASVGTPLVATADGYLSSYFQPGRNFVYGKYVVLSHGNGYRSLYAHLSEHMPNGRYARGEIIAKSGISGTDNPHLHFELLSSTKSKFGANRGFGWRTDPYDIYKTNRFYPGGRDYRGLGPNHYWMYGRPTIFKPPVIAPVLTGEVSLKKANLQWSESPSKDFKRYEVYFSETEGGTTRPETRALLATITNREEAVFISSVNLSVKKDYFFAVATFEKDGRSGISNEIKLRREYEFINLTNSIQNQNEPRIQGGYVVWWDRRIEQTFFPISRTLHYYDLNGKKIKTGEIGSFLNRLSGPYAPDIHGGRVCFFARESAAGRGEIYCRNLNDGYDLPITNNSAHDSYPRISETGYVVWTRSVGGHTKLYALNLNNAKGEFRVTDAPFSQRLPSISGNVVVWKDTRSGNRTDIYMKDLSGGEEVLLVRNTLGGGVEISGDYITWTSRGSVHLMNIKTKEKRIIASGNVRGSEIEGNRVLYFKYDEGVYGNIHIYDINTSSHTKIDNPLPWVSGMDIYGNVLVFAAPGPTELHANSADIFLVHL